MGDTYGAWDASHDGKRYLIISKAYACALAIAKRQFGEQVTLALIATDNPAKQTFFKGVLVDERTEDESQ